MLAALVTVPMAFAAFFAGVAAPTAATAVTGHSSSTSSSPTRPTVSMIPDRLAGWWLASVVGTIAVLVLPDPGRASISCILASAE